MSQGAAPAEGGKQRQWRWWALALVVLAWLAMGRVVTNDFTTWDDPHTIYANPRFNPPDWRRIAELWDPREEQASLWVPVTYSVWGVLAEMTWIAVPDEYGISVNPAVYHGASVAAHSLTALLAMALMVRLLPRLGVKDPIPWAFTGAAMFAVHPVQVETVAWASGLKDVLWVLFGVAAVYCNFRWGERGRRIDGWWWMALVLFVLATLSKPTAIVVPVLAVMLRVLVLGAGVVRSVVGMWPWWLVSLAIAWWTSKIQNAAELFELHFWERLLVAADAIAFYVVKLIWPWPLAFDYGRTPTAIQASGAIWWTWTLPAAIAALLVIKRRAWRGPVVGAIWAVVTVGPVLGFRGFFFQYYSTVADHYMYGAMVGVGLAMAWMLAKLPGRFRMAGVAGSVVILALWSVMSIIQAGTWRDSETLYRHGLAVNPRSFASYINLASLRILVYRDGPLPTPAEVREAEQFARKGVESNPDYPKTHDVLGAVQLLMAKVAEAEGDPARAQWYREEALLSIRRTLTASRELPLSIRGNQAINHQAFAYYLVREGRLEEAAYHFQLAIDDLLLARDTRPEVLAQAREMLTETQRLAATRPATRPGE